MISRALTAFRPGTEEAFLIKFLLLRGIFTCFARLQAFHSFCRISLSLFAALSRWIALKSYATF